MSTIAGMQWLERYAVLILPALVVFEQVGIPLPAVPALLVTGALAAAGRVNPWLVIAAIVLVTLPVDLVWHELGRRRGAGVLSGVCRMTLEPDLCVRRTQNVFMRHGVRTLLVAKFLPGLTTVLPPLAGVFGVPRLQFVLHDVAGTVLWAGFWTGMGYVFSNAIDELIARVARYGHGAAILVGTIVLGWIGFKYVRRWLFLRRLRVARIPPEDLKQKLDAGDELAIIDLRTTLDVVAVPWAIPGSRWIPTEHLDEHLEKIPRDRELILYCS